MLTKKNNLISWAGNGQAQQHHHNTSHDEIQEMKID